MSSFLYDLSYLTGTTHLYQYGDDKYFNVELGRLTERGFSKGNKHYWEYPPHRGALLYSVTAQHANKDLENIGWSYTV